MRGRPVLTLAITVVVLMGLVAFFTVGPKRIRYWRCQDSVERPTRSAAIDAYYEYCWTKAELRNGPSDSDIESGTGADWYQVQVYGIAKRQGVSFLFIGRKTPDSGWTVISEASGP